jgi:ribosomal protein S27AE
MKTKTFYQEIDLRSKKQMIDFLVNHYRYNTMNSWNNSTSYANKMKIYNCIPNELQNKVFELMKAENFYDDLNWVIENWNAENNYNYQAGFNGRSGGYLVMYEGGKKESEHKSICTNCGQKNFTEATETNKNCGRCGNDTRVNKKMFTIYSKPGLSIDQNEDFEEWSIDSIKERVKLVQSFDKLCDDIVDEVISMAQNNEIEEEEYTVTKTRKVII